MSDAAQGEPQPLAVFSTPFHVVPTFEEWPTPDNYRRYPAGKDLPAKLKVWRVQDSGKTFGSVVSSGEGFEDSPDTEMIVRGYNTGKGPAEVGIGRQGNYLQWGFSAPPSKMTEAGRNLFVNCLCYIRKFDGKGPLVFHQSGPRTGAVMMAQLTGQIKDKKFLDAYFPADVQAKYKDDPNGMAQYYQDNLELVYSENGYRVDEDLRALGLTSNRKIETLEKLVDLLKDPNQSAAATKVLARYTDQKFEKPEQWQAWLTKNRERIFFTDIGGYKFLVVPEGYPVAPKATPKALPAGY
jgi:hypothetical protein